ncbi:MAG: TIGR02281 family clan AA aspartic protease [Desulfobacteraceae bacterium]
MKEKMYTNKNDYNCTCPHCGTENFRQLAFSMDGMEDEERQLCSNCKRALFEHQSSGFLSGGKKSYWNFNIGYFIIVLLLSGLMIYLNRTFNVLTFKEDSGQIVYEILAILIVSSAMASGKIFQNLKYLAIWAAIFIILMTGYSYRHELSSIKEKVLAQFILVDGFEKTQNSISFPASSDGHFYIRAKVNGIPIIFLADTGASDIVLSPADAGRLGIETDKLRFDRLYETANGIVRGSSIRIADLAIGGIHLKEIGASVNEAQMGKSLLGMTFFRRLESYEVKNSVLTLHWSE